MIAPELIEAVTYLPRTMDSARLVGVALKTQVGNRYGLPAWIELTRAEDEGIARAEWEHLHANANAMDKLYKLAQQSGWEGTPPAHSLSAEGTESIALEQERITQAALTQQAAEMPRETPINGAYRNGHAHKTNGSIYIPPAVDKTVLLRKAADIPMEPISWLWSGWLASGKLHMLGGVPGTGKTTLAMSLAAIVTRGGQWPDGTRFLSPGQVLVWSGEDDAADTLVPRLSAMGADLQRIHIVTDVSDLDGKRPFDPAQDIETLIAKAKSVGDVRLLIVDPVVSSIAGDSHKNAEVRRGLAPLVTFAQAIRAAVLGITHFSKGTQGKDPLDRLTGSLAFGAAPRLVLAASKKVAEDGTEEGRIFVRVKSNIGPDGGAIAYSLAQVDLPEGIATSRIAWGAMLEGSARDILANAEQTETDPDERGKLDDAKEFLRTVLKDGPVGSTQVFREARDAGHSEQTLRRAKGALGVVAVKQDMSKGWAWKLNPTKMVKPTEHKGVSIFGNDEHLRENTESEDGQPAEDVQGAVFGRIEHLRTDTETF